MDSRLAQPGNIDLLEAPIAPQHAHALAAHGAGHDCAIKDISCAPASKPPRLVIRGESLEEGAGVGISTGRQERPTAGLERHPRIKKSDVVPGDGAITDWLNVSFPCDERPWVSQRIARMVCEYLGPKFGRFWNRHKGLHGYAESYSSTDGGLLFAYGGQGGTGFVSIPGGGCALVHDWADAVALFQDELKGRITRWDGAVDDFDGVHSVELALDWYLGGKFGTGGQRPSMTQVGNWAEPDGTGRTLYIGKKKHGKELCIYEKGNQLGNPADPWVRWEARFTNRDREIPFDVLISPGSYVAGAYSCLDWISDKASRIRTLARQGQNSYDHLKTYAGITYGRLINVMLEIEGSAEAVVAALRREGMPKRLQLPNVDLPPEDSCAP